MGKTCKNEAVKLGINTLKGLIMDLAYGEGGEEDFKTIVDINETLNILEDEIAAIEEDRDHQKSVASKLRIMHGKELNAMCDVAGIK